MFSRMVIYSLWTKHLGNTCKYLSSNNTPQLRRKQLASDLVKSILENNKFSSNNDWKPIREQILQHEENRGRLSADNIDAVILNYCILHNTDIGFSYIDYMKKENMKQNLATIGKYLHLIYLKNEKYLLEGQKCPDSEQKHILECYTSLRKQYPILDANILEKAVFVLALTSHWHKCLELKKEIEMTSSGSIKGDSTIAAAAFLNGEHDLAWKLLEEMFSKEKEPLSLPFITFINLAKMYKSEEAKLKLEKLLLFFQENDYVCKEDFISNLSTFLGVVGLKGVPINVNQRGNCINCQNTLEKYELSVEEFEDLKKVFFQNVIIGKDVFLKTNPNELESFKTFLIGMDKYDVVLDGLNIAYRAGANSPKIMSKMVAAVVSYFAQQKKKILLIGRIHMKKWPSNNWAYISKNSTVFLTQDISQDDPYLLYCALSSGKDTILVTNDLMRQHKFRLNSAKYKMIFSRWLTQRQYQLKTVTENGRPIFKYSPFSITVQKNGCTWHIPYKQNDTKDEYHKTWFCIKWK